MSGRTYEDGRRNAIRACVRWLHERASQMNDPHAKAVLNSAAFALGTDKPNPIKRLRMLTENTNADVLIERLKQLAWSDELRHEVAGQLFDREIPCYPKYLDDAWTAFLDHPKVRAALTDPSLPNPQGE